MGDERERADAARRVEVPHAQLAPEVLRRLIEEFVTRDGTDYGAIERTLAEKVAIVVRQLEAGEVAIVVDAESETVDIVVRRSG
ncbi:MAG: YheU family protein [Acidobacteria bacterium]|nr:YheU family protein [Acidobacteriota bacterium]